MALRADVEEHHRLRAVVMTAHLLRRRVHRLSHVVMNAHLLRRVQQHALRQEVFSGNDKENY
jgi:hypothetical protein